MPVIVVAATRVLVHYVVISVVGIVDGGGSGSLL